MQRLHAGCLALLCLLCTHAAIAAFEITTRERAISGNPGITETIWQTGVAPGGEYDRIGLHRYRVTDKAVKAVLLYLPGTNMNGELAITDPDHNLWLYLAARGIVVYTLDYRTHAVPNEPVPDLAFMREWTLAAFVNDAALAARQVRGLESDTPLFVSGFSRGVSYAYALAGAEHFAGLIALDGSFKHFDPQSAADAAGAREKAMKTLSASGEWGSILSRSRGWSSRSEMMRRTWENPNGPAMGKFDSIGAQLTATLYNAWGPGGLANPVDGISSIEVLARAMEGYDRCFPAIQNLEGRSIASQADDPTTALDDHFGTMTLPILYFGATNLGADNLLNGIYSASRSGSKDVTVNVLENHGHVDVLYGNRARELVYAVMVDWISDRLTTDED